MLLNCTIMSATWVLGNWSSREIQFASLSSILRPWECFLEVFTLRAGRYGSIRAEMWLPGELTIEIQPLLR